MTETTMRETPAGHDPRAHDAAEKTPPAAVTRVGVVGLGLRSGVARHIASSGLPARVTDICDPMAARREQASTVFPGAVAHQGLDQLLAAGVDAVIITTPDHTHEDLVLQCVEAGVSVFVEKPLAITTEGCDRVLQAAREAGTKVYVGHNMRHMPVIRAMKSIIDSGEIGQVKAIWCRHFVGHGGDFYFKDWHADRRNTMSLLLQKGAHDIDVIHWLGGGRSTRVHAMGDLMVYGDITARGGQGDRTMGEWFDADTWPPTAQTGLNDVVDVEDLSMVQMHLDNGVLASYQQCHFTPDYWRNYTVIGTHGRIENFGDSDGAVVKVWNSGRSGYRSDADREIQLGTEAGGHGGADPRLIREFLEFVRHDAATETSPVAARNAVAAGCAATESLRSGGAVREVQGLEDDLVQYFAANQRSGE